MTRRSARFREIAERTDVTCAELGVRVDPADVDTALWQRIEHVAQIMGLSPRAAILYTPDDLPHDLAAELVQRVGRKQSGTERHLRVVE